MGSRRLRAGAAAAIAALALGGCGGSGHPTGSRGTKVASSREASFRSRGRLASLRLWVNPDTPAIAQIRVWRAHGRDAQATELEAIARRPTAVWFTSSADPAATAQATLDAAQREHAVAQLVLYDIPDRDCHSYSAGGATGSTAYLRWVREFAQALGGHQVIVILEPDALDQAASGDCMSSAAAAARYHLMDQAVHALGHDHHAHVYIDAGHSGWVPAATIAPALRAAGIAHAAGFAVNVANFDTTAQSIAYGDDLSRLVGHAHFVIDTSRNGDGPPPGAGGATATWCNPSGRRVGQAPSTDTGHSLVDAYLWVKYPGESDGSCAAGQPPAGAWWPSYALGLLAKAR